MADTKVASFTSRTLTSTTLKALILKCDSKVRAFRGKIMGEAGIVFREGDEFKYAVTTGKGRITLHAMPMYCDPSIKLKHEMRIAGTFGKGCIRIKPDTEIDLKALSAFLKDCAKVKMTNHR